MFGEDKKRTVAIAGWYGHRNMGDSLVLAGLKHLFQDWNFYVMSNTDTSTVPMVDVGLINKCDLFVLGGGELIHTDRLFMNTPSIFGLTIPRLVHRLNNRLKVFDNVSWFNKIKVPKVILGCGVNAENIDVVSDKVLDQLKLFEYIGVRDIKSFEMLNSVKDLRDKLGLFFDVSFSVSLRNNYHNMKKDCAVVIPTDRSTCSDRGVKEVNVGLKSKGWLQDKLDGFKDVMFIPFGREDNSDYNTCRYLASGIKHSEILHPSSVNLNTVVEMISRCSLVIPYRLHGLILSFMLNRKYEYYPYHWKLSRQQDTINNLNVDEIRERQQKTFNDMLINLF